MTPEQKRIITEVAARHRMTLKQLITPGTATERAWPRQEAMYVLRQQLRPDGRHKWSFRRIALAVGLKDHTSAMHGIRRHEERLLHGAKPNRRGCWAQERARA